MNVLGIDPGASGALGVILDTAAIVTDMPTVERMVNKRTRHVVDTNGLWQQVILGPLDAAFLEYVGPMPGEGVHSVFTFGRCVGYCEMALTARGVPWEFVSPLTWKREFGLVGQPKDASRGVALRLFPALAGELARKKDSGRADAVLIAEWGRRQLAKRGEPRVA